jgi:hypothetical protein
MVSPANTYRLGLKKLPNGKYSVIRLDLTHPDWGWETGPDMTVSELLEFGRKHNFSAKDLDLIRLLT